MSDLTVMLFTTAFTPETCLVALTALAAISCESTNPESCTAPRKVSTWIWVEVTPRSLISAVRTRFVISGSSNDSPVLCSVLVPAQAASARSAAKTIERRCMAVLQLLVEACRSLKFHCPTQGPEEETARRRTCDSCNFHS